MQLHDSLNAQSGRKGLEGVEPMSLMSGQALRTAMLASTLAAPAWNASAQDGDVAAGAWPLLAKACIHLPCCRPANASPRVVVIGPELSGYRKHQGDDGDGASSVS